MGDISPHFSRHEFACKCGCGFDTIDAELIKYLEEMADHFQTMLKATRILIHVTSGCRCPAHNKAESASKASQHTVGRGIDFWMSYDTVMTTRNVMDPGRVYQFLSNRHIGKFGVGRYSNRTHFDTRTNGPARWDAR